MSRFNDSIKNVDGNSKILPILHSCDAYTFRSILESEILKPKLCPNFNEEYLYTYYGIPSYRKPLEEATKNLAFFPVCFILDYNEIPKLSRLHPFDTGAFFKIPEIKREYFHPNMEISDFELDPEIQNAVKVVEKFYTSNKKYIENSPSINADNFEESEFEARSYTSLISGQANTNYDNRVSTIEMIFNEKISLTIKSFVQVIMPNSFLGDFKIMSKLKDDFKIPEPLTYYTLKGNPIENFGSVYNEYRKFIELNKMI
ncbi:MAG: hypothetical protein R2781_09565 [Flavobacteriaceae bacterium]